MRAPYSFAGESIPPGQNRVVNIPLSMMSDHTPATLSVLVIHGRREGPTLFVSAAVHGDEINGIEIVRRLARLADLRSVAGTILLIPVVNSFGFITQSRYLPDRRDLNRSFPGSAAGSLAARLANLFLTEVVGRCDFGIDLHTAAIHRTNLPQIRVDMSDEKAVELAKKFGAPVIVNSTLRDGSLRLAAHELDVPVIVFEAGEALRFDDVAIRVGMNGVLSVLAEVGMLRKRRRKSAAAKSIFVQSSKWLRAAEGGVLRIRRKVGDQIRKDDLLGIISDPFGARETEMRAPFEGLIIGQSNLPIVNQGDALLHVAAISLDSFSDSIIDDMGGTMDGDPILDEDEIL